MTREYEPLGPCYRIEASPIGCEADPTGTIQPKAGDTAITLLPPMFLAGEGVDTSMPGMGSIEAYRYAGYEGPGSGPGSITPYDPPRGTLQPYRPPGGGGGGSWTPDPIEPPPPDPPGRIVRAEPTFETSFVQLRYN